jgi:hypothetical protein
MNTTSRLIVAVGAFAAFIGLAAFLHSQGEPQRARAQATPFPTINSSDPISEPQKALDEVRDAIADAKDASNAAGPVITLIAFATYFLPLIVAVRRWHRSTKAIGMLTLFLGWTIVGWVIALRWACNDNIKTAAERKHA